MHQHSRVTFVLFAALLLPCAAKAAGSCSDLLKFSAPGTTISKAGDMTASTIPAPLGAPPIPLHAPAHCRVEGLIGAHQGSDGKSYGIRFAVAMPPNWNGRLLYQGGGGLNGSVQPPLGVTAAGETSGLSRGFAVVSSDSGHEGAVFDASFFADQQAALDF